jgi:dolichol-phosphate mannosyltransferase
MKVSVILPTYNEAGNITRLVDAILAIMPEEIEPEIIVVDDNSTDGTLQLVRDRFGDDNRVIALLRTTDRGLAKSVRAGIERSTGDRLIVMDTDFTHDPIEIPRLLHVGQMYDLVSGSRFCPGGRMQDTTHHIASLSYNWVLRILLRTQVQDNLGGYFTIRRSVLKDIPFDTVFQGYGEYYFRLLYHLQLQERTLVEIPAVYLARTAGQSKSRFLTMLVRYSWAAIELRRKVPRFRKVSP